MASNLAMTNALDMGTPFDEQSFREWYSDIAIRTGINPDPDDPRQFYDYRKAYDAKAEPQMGDDGNYHWTSQFKFTEEEYGVDHPNRFVDGVDTVTGQPENVVRGVREVRNALAMQQSGEVSLDDLIRQAEQAAGIATTPQTGLEEDTSLDALIAQAEQAAGLGKEEEAKPELSAERIWGAVKEGFKETLRTKATAITAARDLSFPWMPQRTAEDLQNVNEITGLAPNKEYEGKSSGWFEDLARGGPQMLGQIADYVINPWLSIVDMGLQIAGGDYERAVKEGRDPSRSFAWGMANAIMQTPLEYIGISKITNLWKPHASLLKWFRDLGETAGVEWFTEFVQGIPEVISDVFSKNPKNTMAENAKKVWEALPEGLKQSAYEGTLTAPWTLLGLGGIHRRIQEEKTEQGKGKKTREETANAKRETLGEAAPIDEDAVNRMFQDTDEEYDEITGKEVPTKATPGGETPGLAAKRPPGQESAPAQEAPPEEEEELPEGEGNTLIEKAQDKISLYRQELEALKGVEGKKAKNQRKRIKVSIRKLNDLIEETKAPERAKRAYLRDQEKFGLMESEEGTEETAGYVPSKEVPGEPTPDMGPSAMQQLRGILYGAKGRLVETPEVAGEARGAGEIVEPGPDLEVDTEATEAQKEAGNYKKAHLNVSGLDVSIETPAGAKRRPEWPALKNHYGYIRRTEDKDGDQVDVFLGPEVEPKQAFVVDQIVPETGKFDEHKVMLGFANAGEARRAYQDNYAPGWKGLGGITAMPIDDFKTWLKEGDTKKPVAQQPKIEAKPSPQFEAKGKDILPLITSLQRPGQPRSLVSISELRDKAEMPPEAFDKALLALSQEGKVALHKHDFAASLSEAERQKLLSVENPKAHWGGRDYYVGVVPKGEAAPEELQAVTKAWNSDLTKAGRFTAANEAGFRGKNAERIAGTYWEHISPEERAKLESVRDKWGAEKQAVELKASEATAADVEAELDRQLAQMEEKEPEKKEEPKAGSAPTEYKEGDRVVATRNGQSRHGSVIKAHTFFIGSVYGGAKLSQTTSFDVQTDQGAKWVAVSPKELEAEQERPAKVIPDIEVRKGEFKEPEDVLASYRWYLKGAKDKLAASARAHKNASKGAHQREAAKYQADADLDRVAFEKWAEANSEGLQALKDKGVNIPWETAAPTVRPTIAAGQKPRIPLTYHETTHAKKNIPLYVVAMGERVSREDFVTLRQKASSLGGYWSRYAQQGAIPGFQFEDKAKALEMMQTYGYETEEAKAEEKESQTGPTAAEKAAETVDHVKNVLDGVKKLNTIIGDIGEAGPGKEVDLSVYEKMRPILQEMWSEAKLAGKSTKEFVSLVLKELKEKGVPYFRKFIKEEIGGEQGGARTLREHGEKPLEEAEAENVPGTPTEGRTGEGAATRPGQNLEGNLRPSGERGAGVPGGGVGVAEVRPVAGGERPTGTGGIQPRLGNYRITDADPLEEGGEVTKYHKNIAAIKLLKQIESESRLATPEEQRTLVQYTGWGGLSKAFKSYYYGSKDDEAWENRNKELRELLTEEEYDEVRGTTPNAHFTSPLVTSSIWDGIKRYGFRKGRFLEPSMGVGHFFGMMPADIDAKLVGVELDSITGRIARQLYQNADVRIMGFEKTAIPDDFFDVVSSNVPFGDYQVADKRYDKLRFNIHNYFFAKSIDKVRPNGLIAFITSSSTMDAKTSRAREYIAARTELIGAIRLPSSAFKGIANTEVTTDIIFLRKLEKDEKPTGPAWIKTAPWKIGKDEEVLVNEYFHANPKNLLGKVDSDKLHPDRAGLTPDGRDLKSILTEAINRTIPENAYQEQKQLATVDAQPAELMPAPDELKMHALTIKDGIVYQKLPSAIIGEPAVLQKVDVSTDAQKRIQGMIRLRGIVRETLRNQLNGLDQTLKSDLKALNKAYDDFVKKHGILHGRLNLVAFEGDPDRPLLLALEKYDKDSKTAKKADIFEKRVMAKYTPVTRVDNPQDALIATLFDRGQIDFPHMSAISGMTDFELQEALAGMIYQNPEGGQWETSDEYLSGNVRNKLGAATAAAKVDPKFQTNVDALQKVQPQDLMPNQINVKPGAVWLPGDILKSFLASELGYFHHSPRFIPALGTWVIEKEQHPSYDRDLVEKWSTNRMDALQIFTHALNETTPVVRDSDKDGKTWINQAATLSAQNKLQEMKDYFGGNRDKGIEGWIWTDETRAKELVRFYNDTFNAIQRRVFDGSHIKQLPGLAYGVELHPHQKNAIWRTVRGKNALLAHVVGSGKTLTMIASAMEMKRLGLVKKPIFMVPKHLIKGTWQKQFMQFYPAAKLLVADEDDFTPQKRREFISRIVTGEWDSVIVTYEQFGKLPMSVEAQSGFIREQLRELEDAILAEQGEAESNQGWGRRRSTKKSRTQKELEKAKKRLEAKLTRLMEGPRDDAVIFEELGIDQIFVDESHNFKNLFFTTRKTRVAGISTTNSNRANDLFMKTQYLTKLNNGRGIVFATGTPISNTMAEAFNVSRYLNHRALQDLNIHNFDAWASIFGDVVTGWEVTPTGAGFRQNSRFARFINVPELMNIFTENADVVTQDDIKLPIPDLKGGKAQVEMSEASETLKAYVAHLVDRMDAIKTGQVDPRQDNPLKVTTDGRKAALDIRLVLPDQPDNPNSKVNRAVENVARIWKETRDKKLTQLVFCDLSKPDKTKFNVYDDVKAKLIGFGIPKNEVAFIHDANTDDKKLSLFQKINEGTIRVLIGSTKKMGEGMNVQERLYAIHHLDAPWRPSDIEQRNGRILRQGNTNKEVEEFRYVTKGSFDAYMWQLLEGKARFIAALLHNKTGARTAEDIESIVLTYAEVKAIASDNPLILDKVKADSELRKYEALLKDHEDSLWRVRLKLSSLPAEIGYQKDKLKLIESDIKTVGEKIPTDIELEGKKYNEETKKEAALHLIKLVKKELANTTSSQEGTGVGTFMGLPLWLRKNVGDTTPPVAFIFGEYRLLESLPNPLAYVDEATNIQGYLARLSKQKAELTLWKERHEKNEKEDTDSLNRYKKLVNEPFKYQTELEAARAKAAEIDAKLEIGQPQNVAPVEEEEAEPITEEEAQEADEEDIEDISPMGLKTTARFPDHPSKKAIDEHLSPILAKLKGLPPVFVVEHWGELPGGVQKFYEKHEGKGSYAAMFVRFNNGKSAIYILADKQASLQTAMGSLWHEGGHFALRQTLVAESQEYNTFLDDLYESKHKERIKALGKDYKFNLQTSEGRRKAADEFWARICSSDEFSLNDSWFRQTLDRFVTIVRKMMRQVGLRVQITNAEIRDMMRRAYRELEREVPTAGQGGRVTGVSADTERQLAPTFYSQMERTLSQKLPGAGTAEQFRGMVKSWSDKGEFKNDEYKWSGIDEWLSGKEGRVSKQDILDFVKANEVQIREVTKGEGWIIDHPEAKDKIFSSRREALDFASDLKIDPIFVKEDTTKFSKWQLPGGENYRELLLTLPQKRSFPPMPKYKDWLKTQDWYKSGAEEDGPKARRLYAQWQERAREGQLEPGYRSTHWSEPNVLAHVRFNDRTGPNGERILFLEEVQSDWHQAGRKRGYRKPLRIQEYTIASQGEAEISGRPIGTKMFMALDEEAHLYASGTRREEVEQTGNSIYASKTVPPAPFSKTWHEFVMKRMIRYAAENGYDRVAWTTGEQQAERYDLSKQIKRIVAFRVGNGEVMLWVEDKNGTMLQSEIAERYGEYDENNKSAVIKEEDLPDIIGKDLSEKILKQEPAKEVEYSGLDLKVGGEGMKGFYDTMLPAFLNRYAKRWGARVEKTQIPGETGMGAYTGPTYTVEALEDMKSGESRDWNVATYNTLRDVVQEMQTNGTDFEKAIQVAGSIALADKLGGKMTWEKQPATVHSVPITDAMRESVMFQGQAMFQKLIPSDVNTPVVHLPNKGREGGFKKLPGVYLRWGEPPKEGVSKNWLSNRPEKGVSVISAWKDPKTGKYVLQEGGEDLINTIGNFTADAQEPEKAYKVNVRKLYEVQGEDTGEVGGDEEPLLKNAKIVREVGLDDVVTSADPWLTLAGTELTDKETPDWSKADETVADISGEKVDAEAWNKAVIDRWNKAHPGTEKKIAEEQKTIEKEFTKQAVEVLPKLNKLWKARSTNWKPQKPDTAVLDRILSVPSHHFEKVEALDKMFNSSLKRPDTYFELLNAITKSDQGGFFTQKLSDLRKKDPEAYKALQSYLVSRDRNQIGYKVVRDKDAEKEQYLLFNPKRQKIGTFDSEIKAWGKAIALEAQDYQKGGASDLAVESLVGARMITHRGFEILIKSMRNIIAQFQADGMVPSVTINVDGKAVEVNLTTEIARMGDMRGYYFPRIRRPGRFMLTAKKEGVNPVMEFFDTKTMMARRQLQLENQGYKVEKDLAPKLPEDVFEMAGSTIAMQATINQALERVHSKGLSLEDFGLSVISRLVKPGLRDFVVTGPTSKKMTPIFKELGGKFYSAYPGETRAWHFFNAGPKFEQRLAKALGNSIDIVDLETEKLFAKALAEQVANVIKGRGYLSHRIQRKPDKGADVWVGYEEDPAIALAKYARGLAAGEAKRINAIEMVRAFTGTDQSWQDFKGETGGTYEDYLAQVEERRVNPQKQPNAFKEGKVYMEDMLRNEEWIDRAIGTVKGVAVLKYLGFRVAAPVVNLTAMVTSVPAAMNAYGDIPLHATFRHLGQAADLYRTFKFGKAESLPENVRKVFTEIERRGWDKSQFNQEALAVLEGKFGRGWNKLIDVSMWMFGKTEQLNRVSTIAGSFLGVTRSHPEMGFDDTLELAKKISDRAHGVYRKANLPHYVRGPHLAAQIAKMFYVFRTFSHNYLLTMKEVGIDQGNAKALAYMLLSPAVLAGTGATIATPILMALAQALGIGGDDPEEEFYAWLDENLGEYGERAGRYGLFGLLGVNVKGSLQIAITDIPTTIPEVLGAPGSVISDLYYGVENITKGDVLKGVEKLIPNAAAGIVRGYREATEGVTTRTNAPVFYGKEPLVADTVEAIYRGLSFNPARIAGIREKLWHEKQAEERYAEDSTKIYARFKKFFLKDEANRSEADYIDLLNEVNDYNEEIRRRGLEGRIPFITSQSIRTNLRRSFIPSKKERIREGKQTSAKEVPVKEQPRYGLSTYQQPAITPPPPVEEMVVPPPAEGMMATGGDGGGDTEGAAAGA